MSSMMASIEAVGKRGEEAALNILTSMARTPNSQVPLLLKASGNLRVGQYQGIHEPLVDMIMVREEPNVSGTHSHSSRVVYLIEVSTTNRPENGEWVGMQTHQRDIAVDLMASGNPIFTMDLLERLQLPVALPVAYSDQGAPQYTLGALLGLPVRYMVVRAILHPASANIKWIFEDPAQMVADGLLDWTDEASGGRPFVRVRPTTLLKNPYPTWMPQLPLSVMLLQGPANGAPSSGVLNDPGSVAGLRESIEMLTWSFKEMAQEMTRVVQEMREMRAALDGAQYNIPTPSPKRSKLVTHNSQQLLVGCL